MYGYVHACERVSVSHHVGAGTSEGHELGVEL